MLFLEHIRGPLSGQGFSIQDDKAIVIGRDHTADLTIPELTISRKHCEIFWLEGDPWIKDLSSRNGTYLNGVRIADEQRLNAGDRIQLAQGVEFYATIGSSVKRIPDSSFRSVIRYEPENGLALAEYSADNSGQMLRDLNTLYQIGNLISAEKKKKPLLSRIGDMVNDVIGPDRTVIMLRKQDSDELEKIPILHSQGENFEQSTPSSTVIKRCLNEGVSIISDDALSDNRFKSGDSILTSGIKAVMCAPIESRDQVLGVLYVDSMKYGRVFTDRDLILLSAIGKQAGVAVERAMLSERLELFLLDTVRTLVATIEAKDRYTRGHSERVTYFSTKIAETMALSEQDVTDLKIAGLLHDIGKIGIPEAVLLKPGRLSDDEFKIIKQHPGLGADIVKNIKGTERIVKAIRHHHERYDGRGYPDGLEGQDIPFLSRIIAVADSYDAMTLDRPYRTALSVEKAKEEIMLNSGSQFDPTTADALLKWLNDNLEEPSPTIIHTFIDPQKTDR